MVEVAEEGEVAGGQKDLVNKARKYRKMLGGGMHQASIIEAPGIVALNSMVVRLAEDHENARILTDGLQKLGIKITNNLMTNLYT